MMKRRPFGGTLASGLAGTGVAAASLSGAHRPRKNMLMRCRDRIRKRPQSDEVKRTTRLMPVGSGWEGDG